jgi:signal transduction histidine kinase
MPRPPLIRSLRGRLIGWHLFILAISLALFSALLYAFLSRSLYQHHDAELAIEADRSARALAGVDFTHEPAVPVLVPSQISEEFLIVRNIRGELLYRSPLLEITEPNIGEHEALVHAATLGVQAPQFFTTHLQRTGQVRFICIPIGTPARAYLQLGRPLGDVPDTMRTVAIACALLVPVILVLMSFSGWLIAGHALAPMKAIDETLQAIQATDLSRRLDVPADVELGGLVTTLNRLLARLEKAFSSLKQFTADISHQLQTPLTVIKGTADVALGSTRGAAEYQGALADIGEEIDDMTSILADLRALSLADAGPGASEHGAVNLSDVAREVAEILEALAESKHISVDTVIDPGLPVWGSGVGLKQVLLNLVDNAVKYTGPEGRIRVQLRAEPPDVVLTVSDTGVGIAPDDLPRVFDRFYRVSGSDPRSRGGTGLGLAIAKRIVEAHGGSITVESRVSQGSTFTVRLPLAR